MIHPRNLGFGEERNEEYRLASASAGRSTSALRRRLIVPHLRISRS